MTQSQYALRSVVTPVGSLLPFLWFLCLTESSLTFVPLIFFFFLFFRDSFTMLLRQASNSWAQVNPVASASQVAGPLGVHHHARLVFCTFEKSLFLSCAVTLKKFCGWEWAKYLKIGPAELVTKTLYLLHGSWTTPPQPLSPVIRIRKGSYTWDLVSGIKRSGVIHPWLLPLSQPHIQPNRKPYWVWSEHS